MSDPRTVYEAIENLFGCDLLVDVIYRAPVTEIRAEVGIFGGKVWQIEFDINGNDPLVPEPRYTSAHPAGFLEFLPLQWGETAPDRVIRDAGRMAEALKDARHIFRETENPSPTL